MINLCNPSPKLAFAIVSFFLGELGDGLNIFQVRHMSVVVPETLYQQGLDSANHYSVIALVCRLQTF
jgi:hypothetical protein